MSNTIYCISDLHIGDHGDRDVFIKKGRLPELHSFLSFIRCEQETNNAELFILGDLFEFWQSSIGNVLTNNEKTIDLLGEVNAKYIVGNHDGDILPLAGSSWLNKQLFRNISVNDKGDSIYKRNINGIDCIFKHGHDVDPANMGNIPGQGRFWTIFSGMVKDEVSINPDLDIAEVDNILLLIIETYKELLGKQREEIELPRERTLSLNPMGIIQTGISLYKKVSTIKPYADPIISTIKKLKQTNGIDELAIINALRASISTPRTKFIIGHTHTPRLYDNWYYNSGSWVEDQADVLILDQHGNASLKKWMGESLK